MELNIIVFLAAFCGGVLGTAIGALPAFIFCGVTGLVSIGVIAAGGSDVFLGELAFGPLFGPHIVFAAGVASAALAGNKKKLLGTGMDILTPLVKTKNLQVYFTGGIFGILAYLANMIFIRLGLPVDTVAMSVFTSNVVARYAFGTSGMFGEFFNGRKTDKDKYAFVNLKLLAFNIFWSFIIGFLICYIIHTTGISIFFGFCLSATLLIFLQMGFEFPVTHHITLVAAYGYAASGSIFIGGLFGILAHLVGEMVNNTMNSYGDTYIDPPGATIFICSALIFTFM
ncbi:MAG: hypothetical protein D5S00_03905 [Tindallia sp. MSAO_Bac2]|nr:MAG: hypothetical protein D5S00_03905 [Tindallia sp. MSAO_Bac2]